METPRNGLVLDAIEVLNLGRKSEAEHVSSQNPFLRFTIGSQTYKTETKKHVGSHAVFQDSLRFSADAADELKVIALLACAELQNYTFSQITAEHRRTILKHSKSLIGSAKVAVSELGAANSVTLVNSHRTNVGQVKFAMKALVPLDSVSDLSQGKLVLQDRLLQQTPSSAAATSEKGTPVKDTPDSLDSAVFIQNEHHTTHTKRTTTTVEDTALSLHVRAPSQDQEAHTLIEAGKAKLLEDRSRGDRVLSHSGLQNETLLAAAGHLCKLVLAAYLGILDVAFTRAVELLHKPQWAPRQLLGMSHKPLHARLASLASEPVTPQAKTAPDTPLTSGSTPAREEAVTPVANLSSSSSEAAAAAADDLPSLPTHNIASAHQTDDISSQESKRTSLAEKAKDKVPVLASEE